MVQPPLNMMSSCIKDGKLSVRLIKVRISPLAPPCNVQVYYRPICVLTCIAAVSPITYASVTTLSKTASVCVCVCVCVGVIAVFKSPRIAWELHRGEAWLVRSHVSIIRCADPSVWWGAAAPGEAERWHQPEHHRLCAATISPSRSQHTQGMSVHPQIHYASIAPASLLPHCVPAAI